MEHGEGNMGINMGKGNIEEGNMRVGVGNMGKGIWGCRRRTQG